MTCPRIPHLPSCPDSANTLLAAEAEDGGLLASDSELMRRLKKLLFVLKADDPTGYFTSKPDVAQHPQIADLVKNHTHINLVTMTDRTFRGEYRSLASFQTSSDLIANMLLHGPLKDEIHQPQPLLPKTSDLRHQKVSIVQRGADGAFYFSNAIPLKAAVDASDIEPLTKIKIAPTPSIDKSDLPTLGAVSAVPKPPQPPRPKRPPTGIAVEPVEIKDFGPFCSFAPTIDSSKASLSIPESTLLSRSNLRVECSYSSDPSSVLVFNGQQATGPHLEGLVADSHDAQPRAQYLTSQELAALKATAATKLDINKLATSVKDIDWHGVVAAMQPLRRDDDSLQHIDSNTLIAQNRLLTKALIELQNKRFDSKRKGVKSVATSVDDVSQEELHH
eukprot:jgi/Hompol1/1784/HPOL_005734-RA